MKIGDKVVCVDIKPCWCGKLTGLILNQVYVVKSTGFHEWGNSVITLFGFYSKCGSRHTTNDTFDVQRFRKLDDLKAETRVRLEKLIQEYIEQ